MKDSYSWHLNPSHHQGLPATSTTAPRPPGTMVGPQVEGTHTHTTLQRKNRNVYATIRYNPSAFLLVDTYYKHMDHSLWMIGRFQSWHSALPGLNIFWRKPSCLSTLDEFSKRISSLRRWRDGFAFQFQYHQYHQYLTPIWIQSWGVRGVWIMMDYDLEHGVLIWRPWALQIVPKCTKQIPPNFLKLT